MNQSQIHNALRWAKALESGEFKQGSFQLVQHFRGEKVHCCIGVAANVMGLSEGALPYWRTGSYSYGVIDGNGRKWICNLDDTWFEETFGMKQEPFTHLNDRLRWSFRWIARCIRWRVFWARLKLFSGNLSDLFAEIMGRT